VEKEDDMQDSREKLSVNEESADDGWEMGVVTQVS
jgi:hypothetical protein